jgi:hypothetical protein
MDRLDVIVAGPVTAPDTGEIGYIDARPYALLVTLHADTGEVRIEHQAGDAARADADMARLAAEIIEQLGTAPVVRALLDIGADTALDLTPPAPPPPPVVVPAPRRGRAVLACRCGAPLDRETMRFERRPVARRRGNAATIPVVCCPRCADRHQPRDIRGTGA